MHPQLPSDCSPEPRDTHPVHPSPNGCPPSNRRWKVILHRTLDKDLMFIVKTLMELTRYGRAEATYRMWRSYHWGESQILLTHFERGELYVEQFADRGLIVSLQPV